MAVTQYASDDQVAVNHETRDKWYAVDVLFCTGKEENQTFVYKTAFKLPPGRLRIVRTPNGALQVVEVVTSRAPTDADCLMCHQWAHDTLYTEPHIATLFDYDVKAVAERAKARQDLAVTAQLRAALERVEVIR